MRTPNKPLLIGLLNYLEIPTTLIKKLRSSNLYLLNKS